MLKDTYEKLKQLTIFYYSYKKCVQTLIPDKNKNMFYILYD